MTPSPLITTVELTSFSVAIDELDTDAAERGVRYQPGARHRHTRFGVRIHTDAGISGSYVPPRSRAMVAMPACRFLADLLVGKPALERERHYQAMRRATKHVGELGIGPLDIALWDLAGKLQDMSIAQMLGGYRWRLPAYASTLGGDRQPDGLSSPEAYADFAVQCSELGYRAYKMHGWSAGEAAEEIAMLRAVGDRVGADMTLMYDAACHLPTLADAIRVGRVCDEYGYAWFEDPYADGGLSATGHRTLRQRITTPVLITEHAHNPQTKLALLEAAATDMLRVDPDYDGGITGCLKVALAAEVLGVDAEVHACGPAMRQLMA
ncbi:MAG: mandelate racemase/muconate lactonizing protein, partial [Gammaproteobacteria bacterium]|nr:mandelate racemase/muconate lactonizing protein [Gammaproteobacteria bacterium]